MNNFIRSSSAIIPATIITFFLFLGMYSLVIHNKHNRSTNDENISINFTPMKIDEKLIINEPVKPTKPEKPKKRPKINPTPELTKPTPERNPPIAEIPPLIFSMNGSGPNIGPGGADNGGGTENADIIPLVTIAPNYPRVAAQAKIEGWVKIEFTVSTTGSVIHPKVIEAKPARIFNREALRAISKYRFKPKYVNGVAVEQVATQTIEFKIAKN